MLNVAVALQPEREHWYGSEEFLALPAQLRKTEMLALKLESLAQSLPLVGAARVQSPASVSLLHDEAHV